MRYDEELYRNNDVNTNFVMTQKYLLIDKFNNVSALFLNKLDKFKKVIDKLYVPVYKSIYPGFFRINEIFYKLDYTKNTTFNIIHDYGSILENLWFKNITNDITYY